MSNTTSLLKHIKEASIEINGACNYSCPSCPQSIGREAAFKKSLPFSLYEKILLDLKLHGCHSVSLQGSGEPFLQRDIAQYISLATSLGIDTHIISNGSLLNDDITSDCLLAGLKSIRFSILGFDEETYKANMGTDFPLFRSIDNLRRFVQLRDLHRSTCRISVYHLIIPCHLSVEEQVRRYQSLTMSLDIGIEIWHSHNWAGRNPLTSTIERNSGPRRSCGRPQADYLTIRAGGTDGLRAAVVPCCFVLGRDGEAQLGNLETQSIQEVLESPAYKQLLAAHTSNNYSSVPYCDSCDQLYDSVEALVWSNSPLRMQGLSHTASTEDPVRFRPSGNSSLDKDDCSITSH